MQCIGIVYGKQVATTGLLPRNRHGMQVILRASMCYGHRYRNIQIQISTTFARLYNVACRDVSPHVTRRFVFQLCVLSLLDQHLTHHTPKLTHHSIKMLNHGSVTSLCARCRLAMTAGLVGPG